MWFNNNMVKNFITPMISTENLIIADIGEEDFASITYRKPNQRNHYIIHFVVSGKGIFSSSNPYQEIKSDLQECTAFAIDPKDTVFYQSFPESPLYYFWIGFNGQESNNILNYIGFSQTTQTLLMKNPDEIIKAFRSLINVWNKKNDNYMLLAEFFKLLAIMRKNCVTQAAHLVLNAEKEILMKAEDYIRAHINENIKIQNITTTLNIDRSYFSKIFKQCYQTTPHQYILKLRLKMAEMLLTATNYTISEIIDRLNFTDQYSFTKQFKKHYHYSPTAYRKLFKNPSDSLSKK